VQEGAGYYQTTMRNGVRSSTATGYLKSARRRVNLKIVSQALATRILSFPKSHPDVLMMQSGQDGNGDNDTRPLNCSMQGRIFL